MNLQPLLTYLVTLVLAALTICIYVALQLGWLYPEQLFYFQSLSIVTAMAEPWRFVSPIFLHHTPLHLLTNLIVWAEFARQIEQQQSHWLLLILVFAISVFSNTLEYVMVDHRFGGLSGVVIGLGVYIAVCSLQTKPSTVVQPVVAKAVAAKPVAVQPVWDFPIMYWLALAGLFLFDMSGKNQQASYFVHAGGLLVGLVFAVVMKQYQQANRTDKQMQ